jgi:hypothetical protein
MKIEEVIKKLIKRFKVVKPELDVEYIPHHNASIEISYNSVVTSVLKPYEFSNRVELEEKKIKELNQNKDK